MYSRILPNSARICTHASDRGGVPQVVLQAPEHLGLRHDLPDSRPVPRVTVQEDRHVLAVEGCSEVGALYAVPEQVRVAVLRFFVDDGRRDEEQDVVVVPDAQRQELPRVLRLEESRVQGGRL